MGMEENQGTSSGALIGGRIYGDRAAFVQFRKEQDEAECRALRILEDAAADKNAVWALADYMLPTDVREMAARWKMTETIQEMWRNAFVAGWRAAHRKSSAPTNHDLAAQPLPNLIQPDTPAEHTTGIEPIGG
jgi:hypothetical protein